MEALNNFSESGKQFSFHRSPIESTNRQNTSFGQNIQTTLSKLPHNTLVNMCLDSYEENQYFRSEHFKISNQLLSQSVQIQQLKEKVQKKRQTVRTIVKNHEKLANMFQQHMKVCSREEVKHEDYWQKKFKQLQHYMNQYVSQNSEIQDEYLNGYKKLKDQNQRAYIEISNLNKKLKQTELLSSTFYLQQSHLNNSQSLNVSYNNQLYKYENQKYKRQIQKFNEQKQKLESDINYLHNDLQKLRQKTRALEIENQSMKAQIYLKKDLITFQIQSHQLENEDKDQNNNFMKSDSYYEDKSKKRNIAIPPLKIQQSLQKFKKIERTHSASYL